MRCGAIKKCWKKFKNKKRKGSLVIYCKLLQKQQQPSKRQVPLGAEETEARQASLMTRTAKKKCSEAKKSLKADNNNKNNKNTENGNCNAQINERENTLLQLFRFFYIFIQFFIIVVVFLLLHEVWNLLFHKSSSFAPVWHFIWLPFFLHFALIVFVVAFWRPRGRLQGKSFWHDCQHVVL